MKNVSWWETPFILNLSYWISGIFNPLFSLLIFFFYFSFLHYDQLFAFKEFLPLLIILILPVSIWIFWNVKTGRYTNKDVSNRKQRNSLYLVIMILFLIYHSYKFYIHNQVNIQMLYLFVLIVIMQVSNFFIKTSMHTALNVFVAGLFWKENEIYGIIWLGLSLIIGITRIILKRHRVSEVAMGFILSVVICVLYNLYQ